MRLVSTTQLHPGMTLGRSVCTADGRVLLRAGTELNKPYIKSLLNYGVWSVYVTDSLTPDAAPADVVPEESRHALAGHLQECMAALEQIPADLPAAEVGRLRLRLNTEGLRKAVSTVVSQVLANPNAVVNLHEIRKADEYTVGHSTNVCLISTLLGASLGYTEAELKELAMGALLHDVGKTLVPAELINKPGRLTAEEYEVIKTHTTLGWQVLQSQTDLSPVAAIIALQHHERWKGGGYPNGTAGNKIHRFARVCAVADCFDALTADRSYRPGIRPSQALALMTGELATSFQPEILLALLGCVAPYPVGTSVELTGGLRAVVTEVDRLTPARPTVRVTAEPGGELPEPYEVNLAHEPRLRILRELDLQETAPGVELLG